MRNTAAQNPNTNRILPAARNVGIDRGSCSWFERPMVGNNIGDRLQIIDDSFAIVTWNGTEWIGGATVKQSVDASRTLTQADFETILSCASAITLTLPNDTTLGITDTSYAPSVAIYAAGATAPTLDVSAVTMRGTAPTVAQYGMYGIVRVGANEWAYV